jgi:putative methyltransferase (TIGR04325 family)
MMPHSLKNLLRDLIPPFLLKVYRGAVYQAEFSGNFPNWTLARQASGGYDSDLILNKVKEALLKVKNGEAVYERDSVLFDSVQYSWPVLAGLLWIASRNNNRLNVVDFGGSLGSSYFQNRRFLAHLDGFAWNIVEQRKFVECGKRYFEDEHLKFYYTLDDCLKEQHADAILLSSVIQYLERPYDLLNEIIEKRFRYLLFDRTPFLTEGDDRITIQRVPAEIYEATYPSWFFNRHKFMDFISASYELLADFESNDRADIPAVFKGYIFKLRDDV